MSDVQAGLRAILSEPANASVLVRFARFAWAVALVPVAVYGVALAALRALVRRNVLSGVGASTPSVAASVCAVLALNILTALFAIGAVTEPVVEHGNAGATGAVEGRSDPAGVAGDGGGGSGGGAGGLKTE
jgi:uncharacterized membrane protein YgcG